MREEIVEVQRAFAFFGAPLAEREQARELRPGGAVLRIGEYIGGRVGEDEPHAGGEAQPMFLRRLMRTHHARNRVAVGDAEAGQPQRFCLHHQLFRVGGPPQEREIGAGGEFSIGGQDAPRPGGG